jgi:hypothetical protein
LRGDGILAGLNTSEANDFRSIKLGKSIKPYITTLPTPVALKSAEINGTAFKFESNKFE